MSICVLVVGGSGMFGHRAWLEFQGRFETWATLRQPESLPPAFNRARVIAPVDITDLRSVERCFEAVKPEVVVNCVGVVKQLPSAKDPIVALTTNSLFPHQLARFCRASGCRLIHLSTDCVFSGRKGLYAEDDPPDAEDLYGRTKLLGEVPSDGALTIRTSIIGRELHATTGLVEWLLSHRGGRVTGYTRAVFSGLTTQTLAMVMARIIEEHDGLSGLYHVAAAPIDKYDLLCRLNDAFRAGITVEPSDELRIDRSLDGRRFRDATGIESPGWDAMIAALAGDPAPYEDWRRAVVS